MRGASLPAKREMFSMESGMKSSSFVLVGSDVVKEMDVLFSFSF